MSALTGLLAAVLGADRTAEVRRTFAVPPVLDPADGAEVSAGSLAFALHLLLADDLLGRVPSAAEYVAARRAAGELVVLDHGAVRTVGGTTVGELPPGAEAITRLLRPLGYVHRETYDLADLRMTGQSWAHRDHPEEVPQFFVSELHVERLPPPVGDAAARVFGSSRDPVEAAADADLRELERTGRLPLDRAPRLLLGLARCFARQHAEPSLADYELMLASSPELAWIATEGHAFNHATDRVADVVALAAAEAAAGRPVKDEVEVSRSGRVLQTAHRAATVERRFATGAGRRTVSRRVPGSFWEFITRRPLPDGSGLDLAFDAANAQGIFTMTRPPP